MENKGFDIIIYTDKYRVQILGGWEQSVLALTSF
jgi:hypothetical protein